MIDQQVTGAADWRSESEKQKSLLRKAAASLFKTWIPDHPEASIERGEVYKLFCEAMGVAPGRKLTLVSQLSTGVEDIYGYEFLEDERLSMQELLVQREGTDAFLDPKNALRVVRRKFNMMTLIGRMASTFEQRNIIAVTIKSGLPQEKLIEFGRVMGMRVEGTAAEEQHAFAKRYKKGRFRDYFDVLYHPELVGRRIPVRWAVKHTYSLLGRELRKGAVPEQATLDVVEARLHNKSAKDLKQLLLFTEDLAEELDAPGGFDPAPLLISHADERKLLTATRSIFDDFKDERRERMHERALHPESTEAEVSKAVDDDFLADVEAGGGDDFDDDFLRMAQALERVREVRGREFFSRISMVSGDVSFVATAQGSGFEKVEQTVAALDPVEGLDQARKVTEPFYRARALAAVVPQLKAVDKVELAESAALESLEAARACHTADEDQAYTAALQALIEVGDLGNAQLAVTEALAKAHEHDQLDERAAALMRVCGTLMEAGALPAEVRTRLSAEILGADIHFWGKPEVSPALVEVILSLLSPDDEDTRLFLQKVVAHPNEEVRRSVIRTMPLGEDVELRNMLLSHLKDKETAVRCEVIERIGWSGDPRLSIYLANHIRHGGATTGNEKRSIALNLARLDAERYLPLFNAMLGSLHTPGAPMTGKKPFKDDDDLQLAVLQTLYYLNSRDARRLIFTAEKKSKGTLGEMIETVWQAVKSVPYGEAQLPRSPHDPQWTEADDVGFMGLLQQIRDAGENEETPSGEDAAPSEVALDDEQTPLAEPPTVPPPPRRKGGLFSRIKSKLFGGEDDDEGESEALVFHADGESAAPAGEDAAPDAVEAEVPTYDGPPRAALRFEGMLLEGPDAWSGELPMEFQIYATEDAVAPVWRERRGAVQVREGSFEVMLGVDNGRLPDELPPQVWLGITVDGAELNPRTRLSRARSVVQG